jgi:hypothetical protein
MADPSSEPELSWHERETLGALRRVANARSQLAALEAEEPVTPIDPAIGREVERVHGELEKAQAKSRSRFGGGAARSRAVDLEAAQSGLLAQLDVASWDAYVAKRDAPPLPIADPAIIDFARRELEAAEKAWLEMQTLKLPDAEEPAPDGAEQHRPERHRHEHEHGHAHERDNVLPYSRPAAS